MFILIVAFTVKSQILNVQPNAYLSFAGAMTFRRAQFGPGSGPIFLSLLGCTGTEETLLACPPANRLGLHSCDHTEDAGVRCVGKGESFDFFITVCVMSIARKYCVGKFLH